MYRTDVVQKFTDEPVEEISQIMAKRTKKEPGAGRDLLIEECKEEPAPMYRRMESNLFADD